MAIIKELQDKGFSKYKIAKLVGVSWNTVHMWTKEVFKPNKAHMDKIEEILDENKNK